MFDAHINNASQPALYSYNIYGICKQTMLNFPTICLGLSLELRVVLSYVCMSASAVTSSLAIASRA